MRSTKTSLLILTFMSSIAVPAFAQVKNGNSIQGKTFIEGATITLKGKNLSTESNPLKVEIVTASNQAFNITDDSKLNKKKDTVRVKLPRVSADSKVTLKITGGNVLADAPQQFTIVIYDNPSDANTDLFADETTIPAGSETGIHADTAVVVTDELQSAITGLPNVGVIGSVGVQTEVASVLLARGGVVGNLTGDISGSAQSFRGNLGGEVSGKQNSVVLDNDAVIAKILNGHVAGAGVVANTDSIEAAIAKLDGNVINNDTDIAANLASIVSVNGKVTTNTGSISSVNGKVTTNTNSISSVNGKVTVNANSIGSLNGNLSARIDATDLLLDNVNGTVTDATNENTADTLVLRDASGNFNGQDITAEGDFYGNLIGTVEGIDVDALNGVVTTNVGDISDLDDYADRLNGRIASVNGRITSEIDTLNGDLTNDINIVSGVANAANNAVTAATSSNTASTLVLRDSNGDFAAGTITATNFVGTFAGSVETALSVPVATLVNGRVPAIDVHGKTSIDVEGLGLIRLTDSNTSGAADAIDTFTNGVAGQSLTIIFGEDVDINDEDDDNLANTINIESIGGGCCTQYEVLEVIFDGLKWYGVSVQKN